MELKKDAKGLIDRSWFANRLDPVPPDAIRKALNRQVVKGARPLAASVLSHWA
jgi:hypothetical protein